MKYDCSKKLDYKQKSNTKSEIIQIIKILSDIALSEKVRLDTLNWKIDILYNNQNVQFDDIKEVVENLPPMARIEGFSVFVEPNLFDFGTFDDTESPFEITVNQYYAEEFLHVLVSSTSDVASQELVLKVESILYSHNEQDKSRKPDEAYSTKSQRDTGNQNHDFGKIGVIVALMIGALTILTSYIFPRLP